MDLSAKCREHWGITQPYLNPFGNTLDNQSALFSWPAFERVVERIVRAVERRQFLVVVGGMCSAKSTAWAEAQRRVREERPLTVFAQPRGLSPADYTEQTIYHSVLTALANDGTAKMPRAREDRARKVRGELERSNDARRPVCLAVNDAQESKLSFLLCCKRLWDDLHGFDRLCSVILIGHPMLASEIVGRREISERTEIVWMEGLGNSLLDYLNYECHRVGMTASPFDESALRALQSLSSENPAETRDHPLIVNNIVSRALSIAHRSRLDVVCDAVITKAIQEDAKRGGDRK